MFIIKLVSLNYIDKIRNWEINNSIASNCNPIEVLDKLENYKKTNNYIKSPPPVNAANKQNNLDEFIIIKTGETLSILAVRYNISVQDLKLINGLKSDLIKVGQKLKIRK